MSEEMRAPVYVHLTACSLLRIDRALRTTC